MYVTSSYFQFSEPTEEHLKQWLTILQAVQRKPLVLGADVNAKSRLWHSPTTDGKGDLLNEFILVEGLHVQNVQGTLPTFVSPVGGEETYLDITCTNDNAATVIQNWTVSEDSSSDHRLILFDLELSRKTTDYETCPERVRYVHRNVNWRAFDNSLCKEVLLAEERSAKLSLDERADMLTAVIHRVCESHMQKASACPKSHPWWDAGLEAERKNVRRLRRRMKSQRNPEIREALLIMYRAQVRSYKNHVKAKRTKAWRSFVTTEGNKDPWGLVYRLCQDKVRASVTLPGIVVDGLAITELKDNLVEIMRVLLPDDTEDGENHLQRHKRDIMGVVMTTPSSPGFTVEELDSVIKGLTNKKAPGIDDVTVEILKRVYARIKELLLRLLNEAFEAGYFPAPWKQGLLKIIYKGGGKSLTSPKSYRPITMLSVIGKVYERLINKRLGDHLESVGGLHELQYGFRRGRSTEAAVLKLKDAVCMATEKYVLAVTLDIAGAFDNAWWPQVLWRLRSLECPTNIYEVVRSFFSERKCVMTVGEVSCCKPLTKGCPQGSVMGPILWNVIFDELLGLPMPEGCIIVGYADDGLLVVPGWSRAEIEDKTESALETISRWAASVKLEIAQDKTQVILLKGRLARSPCIRMRGRPLRVVHEVKYLGILLGEGLSFHQHVRQACTRAVEMMSRMRAVSRATWGLNHWTRLSVYRGVFLPILLYGSRTWFQAALTVHSRRRLVSAQRAALLQVTGAYRSVSNDALCVLAGQIPIDLLVEEVEQRLLGHGEQQIGPKDKSALRERTLVAWQVRWDVSSKGRNTYAVFPEVRERLRCKWLPVNHFTSQFLTGHGNFRWRLHSLALAESPLCVVCGLDDTSAHVLTECLKTEDLRVAYSGEITCAGGNPNDLVSVLSDPALSRIWARYARDLAERLREFELWFEQQGMDDPNNG